MWLRTNEWNIGDWLEIAVDLVSDAACPLCIRPLRKKKKTVSASLTSQWLASLVFTAAIAFLGASARFVRAVRLHPACAVGELMWRGFHTASRRRFQSFGIPFLKALHFAPPQYFFENCPRSRLVCFVRGLHTRCCYQLFLLFDRNTARAVCAPLIS